MKRILIIVLTAILLGNPMFCYAESLEDPIFNEQETEYSEGSYEDGEADESDEGEQSPTNLRDVMQDYGENGMVSEEDASNPNITFIESLISYVVSGVIIIIFLCTFIMTVLDLIYISIPFSRNILLKTNEAKGEGAEPEKKQFVTHEAIYLVQNKESLSNNILVEYFKKRTINMILIVVIVMLLIGSSVITDTGLNIGLMFLKMIKGL